MGKRQNKKGGKNASGGTPNSKPNTPQIEKAGKQTPTPESEQFGNEEALSAEMASFYEAMEDLLKGERKPNAPQMEKAGKQTPTPESEQFGNEEALSAEMASFYEAMENTKVEEKIPRLVPAKENGQENKQNDKAKLSPNAVTPAKASPEKQTPGKADKKTPGKQPAEKLTPGKKTPVKETPVKAVLDIKSPGKTAPPGKQTPGKAGTPGKMEAGQKKTPAATSAIKDEQQKQKRDDSSDVDEEVTKLPVSHSIVPAIAMPTAMPSASIPMTSMPQGMTGANIAGQPPKSHRVVLSNPPPKPAPTLPVPSISIGKMGTAALPSTGMNMTRAPKKNIRLQSAAAATSATSHPGGMSMDLPPVIAKAAKVPPQAYAVQQLMTSDACRLVSHSGQPLPAQQTGQQHPRPAVAPGSQILPQNATFFLGSGSLQSTALPLSIPMTSTDSRQPNEHGGTVLHQLSYTLSDGTRYLTQQQLMNLSNAVNYAPLQPVKTITLQGSANLRPGLVTSQTPSLAASLQCSSHSVVAPVLSSAVAMANQAGRLNTSVFVAMDPSRLASLAMPQNFVAGDVSMPTSSLDKDVTKEVACMEVTPKDVPDGEWQMVRKKKGKKQITSSSSGSKFLLSADNECSWILGMVIDFVHLLQILLDFRNEHPRVPNARPTIKLQNIRLAICFGTGSARPTHFRYSQLEKFDTMADTKNSAFHSSYEAEEFNELLRLCKKPSNASFLDIFGLQLKDVEDVVSQLQQIREELMNDFHFV